MRYMVLPASVLVPTLGSPVLPPCCFAGVSANSHGSASLSASTSPPWSPRTALATQSFGDFCVLRDLRRLHL